MLNPSTKLIVGNIKPPSSSHFRLGDIQVHIVHGKTKEVSVDKPVSLSENIMNYWNALVVDDEWRLVDCYFASQKGEGGKSDWELIDDNGTVSLKFHFLIRNISV